MHERERGGNGKVLLALNVSSEALLKCEMTIKISENKRGWAASKMTNLNFFLLPQMFALKT